MTGSVGTSNDIIPIKAPLFRTLGALSVISLAVIGVVGRRSYKRKVSFLAKQMAEEPGIGNVPQRTLGQPPKVWAVLTPSETLKVFFVPMAFVVGGTYTTGVCVKKWYGIRDWHHAVATMKWVARTGPPPS